MKLCVLPEISHFLQVFTDPIDSVYEALMANPVELPREKLIGSSFCTFLL